MLLTNIILYNCALMSVYIGRKKYQFTIPIMFNNISKIRCIYIPRILRIQFILHICLLILFSVHNIVHKIINDTYIIFCK